MRETRGIILQMLNKNYSSGISGECDTSYLEIIPNRAIPTITLNLMNMSNHKSKLEDKLRKKTCLDHLLVRILVRITHIYIKHVFYYACRTYS